MVDEIDIFNFPIELLDTQSGLESLEKQDGFMRMWLKASFWKRILQNLLAMMGFRLTEHKGKIEMDVHR